MPGPGAPYTNLDFQQVLKQSFDEATDRLRVDAVATIITPPALEVSINQVDDSISIGDGTTLFTGTVQAGAKFSLDVSAYQAGTWSVGRTWTLASGTDSVSAIQSGTWDINNITGTVSLPIGASTSANQTSVIGSSTGGTAATNSLLTGGIYNTSAPVLTNGQQVSLQLDSSGRLITSATATISSDMNYGTVGANTLRSAAQIGNATGAADFNSGVTGAQTLRTIPASDRTPEVATTSTLSNISVTTSSTTLLSSNTSRKQATFYNDGGGTVYLKFGSTASTTSFTIRLQDNDYYELPYPIYNGIITAISASGSRTIRVTELT